MAQFEGSVARYPARAIFYWYVGLCLTGGLLLYLPFCRGEGAAPISLVDAVFTATSACCVTGLSVRSTLNDFSFAGQMVILIWIQLGGIGIMTLTTFFLLTIGRTESLRQRSAMAATIGAKRVENLRGLLARIAILTLSFELIGATLLTIRYALEMPPGPAIWRGVFHAISAFCNAGFALHDGNMAPDRGNILVNLTICGLIVVGGIGFPVLLDIAHSRKSTRGRRIERLELHTKLVLIGTAALIVVGAILILVLEWNNVLNGLPLETKVLAAFFQSVTTRTAGFNTVDIGAMKDATLLIMIGFMMVGAAPCSTGGGFKVSTAMVLLAQVWNRFRGRPVVTIFRRTLSQDLLAQAVSVVMTYLVIMIVGLLLMTVIEEHMRGDVASRRFFLEILFETASAQGTVGLTVNLTPTLSDPAKIVLILLMFIGRIGPVSVVVVLSRESQARRLEFPKEPVLLG